jgi:glycosyltransferase involved in cell wall biosynthesis
MITVMIATYNGANTLPDVLHLFRSLEPPDGGWKIVLVDNGSRDATREIITSFKRVLPITYLLETRRGKNRALNRGLSRLEGDLIVFTDDDALPRPEWLKQFRSAADTQPSYSIFGGPVSPKWESPPEEWILSSVPLGPAFAVLDSTEEGPIPVHYVYGNNMAIRAEVFRAGHRFDEAIGPKGSTYPQGGETELLLRLSRAGLKAWHCTGAIVDHMIRTFQMEKKWILNRAIRYGRGNYRLGNEFPNWRSFLLGIPRCLYLKILDQGCRAARARWSGDAARIMRERWSLNYLLGIAIEARQMNKKE